MSEALAFATATLVGICVAPRMVVLVGGGGLLTTKDKEEDEAYQCHPWSLAEMVASARNKMGSLGLHVFWPTDHL